MKINVEGSKFRDAFAIPPELLVIPGLDNEKTVRPYMRARLLKPISPEFIANIRRYGVIQPVVLEQIDKSTFEVVAGSRRVRAARLVNKENAKDRMEPILVTCIIRTKLDDAFRSGVMISENENREDVENEGKIEEAWTLINVNAYDPADVAVMMGVTLPTLNAWLLDRTFDTHVKTALAEGVIEKTSARALAIMPKDLQAKVLDAAKKISTKKRGKRAGKVSVRDVSRAAAAIKTGVSAPTKTELLTLMGSEIAFRAPPAALEALQWVLGHGPRPQWAQIEESLTTQ